MRRLSLRPRPLPATAQSAWVFAYGSNMHLRDLDRFLDEHRLPAGELYGVEVASLPGYRLVWNYYSRARGGGAANVCKTGRNAEPRFDGADLYGVALHVSPALLRAIDRKEGHPTRYQRELGAVVLRSGQVLNAWVYTVLPQFVSSSTIWPSRAYLDLVLAAALDHGLPVEYQASLRNLQIAR